MLEEIPSHRNRHQVFRLATIDLDEDFMAELQLDSQRVDELRKFLVEGHPTDSLEELLDGPFRQKRRFKRQTRFSDGSFPVFYSSFDAPTAEAEVMHWLPSYIGQPRKPRTVYYRRFRCTFQGVEKDLRSKTKDWPQLMEGNDYTFCNRLGAEARTIRVDALVTFSVRRKEGVNLPIFSRETVDTPRPEAFLAMTYDPTTGNVSVRDVG